jgi:hypothetical protein
VTFRRALLLAASLVWVVCTPLRAQHPEASHSRFSGFIFGDVTFAASERDGPEGFILGQLVGHGNALLTERLSFFGELSATAREAGYAFEVERAIIRYEFADVLKLSIGRYHTPISYWNTAYHHGLWLQTSVARPELIQIGGFYLPVHFMGALAEGVVSNPALSVSWEVGAGNGRGSLLGRPGDTGDVNDETALLGGVRFRPGFARGLQLGGSLYLDRVTTDSAAADERIASAHVVWDSGAPELIAEYVHVRHEDDASATAESHGFYVQAGYRLPGALSAFKPYGRFERLSVDEADPVFVGLRDYEASIAGIRWDFETLAALKAEFRRDRWTDGEWLNSLLVQAAIVVPSFGAVGF